jgi:UDP-3-O-[3-hydroxymyristoyl] glucosamine N-acyltransferase
VLYPGTILGARTVIHAGAVIGADGFGYLQEGKDIEAATGKAIERYMQTDEPHLKVPHFGNVVLGDDVEVGANATIDRGTTGSTVLGKGTKIDNLVQIGHNCSIGEHVLLVGMVGVGGSVTLGDHVTVGGNTGISEGVTLGRFCIVGAHTLIYPGKKFPERTVIWGNPARPAGKIRAQLAALATLPRIVVRMGDLEKRVKAFEDETRGGDRCN